MPTVKISFEWVDIEGATYSVPFHFDAADVPTVAVAQTVATAYEAALEAVSGNAIRRISVEFPLNAPGGQNPDNGYYINSGVYMSYTNSDGVADGFYIPAVTDAKVANGLIIPTDTEVAALIALTLPGSTAEPLSSRGSGSLFTSFNRGKQTTRKIRR